MEPKFKITHIRCRKQQFSYESFKNSELFFEHHAFNNILDQTLSSISKRFEKQKNLMILVDIF